MSSIETSEAGYVFITLFERDGVTGFFADYDGVGTSIEIDGVSVSCIDEFISLDLIRDDDDDDTRTS